MTRCTVCQDPLRADIDHLLAAGRSARSVAGEFRLSVRSVQRHAVSHVTVAAAPTAPPAPKDPLDELLETLRGRALEGRDASVVREYRLALALQAQRRAERPIYNVLADPEWIRLRSIILEVLRPHPEVLAELATALHGALEASE